jgi:hypothetical protein
MGDIKYIITADAKGAIRDIKMVDGAIGGVKQQAIASKAPLMSMFGKIAAGVGGVIALRSAIRGLTGFMGDAIDKAIEQERVEAALNAVLKSTGGIAGLTSGELLKMASGLQAVTTYGDETIIGAENLLLTFTKIGKDIFPEALGTVLDMSTALGQDLKSGAIQVGKALQDPILGVTALRRVGINFNAQQQEEIKLLVESGRQLDAQKIILKELQLEFGGASKAAADTFGGSLKQLGGYWSDLKEGIGEAITENETIKNLIVDLKDKIVELIQSGKLDEWADKASKAINGLVLGVETFYDIVSSGQPAVMTAGENLAEWAMNLTGIEGPQQEANRLMSEAIQRAIGFKDSLKVLQPSMEEIRVEFEKGKDHADAWMEIMRETDDQLYANKDACIAWWKEIYKATGLIREAKEEEEESGPVIKTTTELLETQTRAATVFSTEILGCVGHVLDMKKVMENAQPALKAMFEEAIPAARDFKDVLGLVPPKFDDVELSSENASGSVATDWGDLRNSFEFEYASGIVDSIGDAFGSITTKGSDAKDAINIFFGSMVDNLRTQLRGLLEDFLKENIFDAMVGKAKSAASGVTDALSGAGGVAGAAGGTGGGGGLGGLLGGGTGAAGGIWTGVGAAAGTLLANLTTGGGPSKQTAQDTLQELRLVNLNLLNLTQHEATWILDHIVSMDSNQFPEMLKKQDRTNNHLRAIRDILGEMPSGQGGLSGYTGSRGGMIRVHPDEYYNVTPKLNLNQQFQTVVIEKNDRYIIQVVQKNLDAGNIRVPGQFIK